MCHMSCAKFHVSGFKCPMSHVKPLNFFLIRGGGFLVKLVCGGSGLSSLIEYNVLCKNCAVFLG